MEHTRSMEKSKMSTFDAVRGLWFMSLSDRSFVEMSMYMTDLVVASYTAFYKVLKSTY